MNKASDQVRAQGLPSPVIYTTTAGNPDTKPSQYALKVLQSGTPFTEFMYDLPNRDGLVELIKKSSENLMLYLEFSYKQMGKTDEWLKQIIVRSQASPDDIARDLLNIWQSSNDKSIIPHSIMQKIRESKRDPSYVDLHDGFIVKWYRPRHEITSDKYQSYPMIMGMDTSENVARDYTTFVILDPQDMQIIATCRCNESNTMQVARHVYTLLMRFPLLTWIPERNNTGIGIIDFVIEKLSENNINPFTRIYNDVVQNIKDQKYKNTNIYDFYTLDGHTRSTFGFRTTGTGANGGSRNLLYKTVMMRALEMNNEKIYDSTLISELCNLTEKNGRIDHPDGCHDDTCIAYLLSCYLVYFGRNLHMYNIPEGTILQGITSKGVCVNPDIVNEQLHIQQRIKDLKDKIDTTESNILKIKYTRELKELIPRIDDTILEVEPLAVSQVQYQEKKLLGKNNGATVESLRQFAHRWRKM